ncbi:hypothetical protein [Streptomyces gardneri]|uniref:Lipoprotein n=1 Tax=Streptomyces gardneri TaxID=66892 RepID=A0A4Y3RUP9_9ACTN|nr:hypothetical protein [Streptomyces gardneri]GEB61034.1 hypothetical protein SGA01_66390 [Streptomyces gardneri]GHH14334.1 hypothetical protein GCM10017674_62670 [Streptomyces gardneri]
MRRPLTVPLLLAALALTGCGGDAEPAASRPVPTAPAEAAFVPFYDCLAEQGLKLTETEGGARRVDKDANSEKAQRDADKACRSLMPAELPVDQEQMKQDKALSECVRRNGYPDYPDPDPKTGRLPESEALKYDAGLPEILRKCRPAAAGDQEGQGGAVDGG